MKIVHQPKTLRPYRRLIGMTMAGLLCWNAAPSRAATERSIPEPDAAMVAAHAAAKGDGLLEALLTELERSKAPLKSDQGQGPEYVEDAGNQSGDSVAA